MGSYGSIVWAASGMTWQFSRPALQAFIQARSLFALNMGDGKLQ